MRKIIKRAVVAFFIAPLVSVPAATIWFVINDPKAAPHAIDTMINGSAYILPVAYISTLIFGLPVYFLLWYFKIGHRLLLTLIGFPLALLALSIIQSQFSPGFSIDKDTVGLSALCGISVSGMAMLIVGKNTYNS